MRTEAEFQRVCKDRDEWRDRAEEMVERLDERYRAGFDDGWGKAAVAAIDSMPYPIDADGVPIHVGDVMENIICPSVHREVTGVGVKCFYGWDEDNGRYSQFDVVCYRHHHAPTVEDVLREFAQEMNENLGMYTGEAIDADEWRKADERTIAEYAARLRLAEVVDE